MPTAPEILPTEMTCARTLARDRDRAAAPRTTTRASVRRSSARRGRRECARSSACDDVPRPGRGPLPPAPRVLQDQVARLAHLQRLRGVDDVRGGRPKWSQRADGPTFSATAVVKAMTSCCVVCSISSIRPTSNDASHAKLACGIGGHDPGFGHRVGGGKFDFEPGLVPTLLAPDGPHLRVGVSANHRLSKRLRRLSASGG